jgi:DNA invertase Pin-like site-specific DNA recombinase
MRVAYSYQRFSSDHQSDGDSIRRQTALAESWCKRNQAQLDTSTTYQDKGVSAYRGKHREKGVLASFLAAVEAGRIPRGSVLVLENLDRLSRENPWDSVPLLCSIVNAGVTVVTLSPSEMLYERGRDLTPLILAVVEFGRGNSESAIKSERLLAFWAEKKRLARVEGKIMTRRLPGWIAEKNGKLVLIPTHAKIVRQIFAMCIQGMGTHRIVQQLTKTTPPILGRGRRWTKCSIQKILTSRYAIGEYQPKHGDQPDGDPIPDYYPRVVTDEVFEQAQNALARHKDRRGRIGKKVASLFTGLLMDARTHSRMLINYQSHGKPGNKIRKRILVSADALEGRSQSTSFPYQIFEQAVLSLLKEVNVAQLLGAEPESEVNLLTIQRDGLDERLRQLEEQLTESGEQIPTLIRAVKTLEAKRQEVLTRLAAAQQREANPVSGAWTEAKTLLAVAKDETKRLRLRELLRTIISEAWVLVVPMRPRRLCAVQFFFAEGKGHRDFIIDYHAAGRGRSGGWQARSFSDTDSKVDLDLRRPADARQLEKVLANLRLPE